MTRGDNNLAAPLAMGLSILLLCLFGILTRPHFDLAALWPANAAILGLMLRFPPLARWQCWLACVIAYVAADIFTGTALLTTVVLTACNLLGVGTGYLLLANRPQQDRMLSDPGSVLYFLRAIAGSSLAVGIAGGFANPLLFDGPFLTGFSFWGSAELVNFIALLPIFLTLPATSTLRTLLRRRRIRRSDFNNLLPILLLILSGWIGMQVGGLGAVAFPVPALLWCATRFSPFVTACLSFCFVAWALLSIRMGGLELPIDLNDRAALISTRLGVALVALAPIFVVGVMTARNRMMNRLRYYAERDALTGLRNRRAFFDAGSQILRKLSGAKVPYSAMIVSVDNFKQLVSEHGYERVDQILAKIGPTLERTLRPNDLIGRIAADEFAALLPQCRAEAATSVAWRVVAAVRNQDLGAVAGQDEPPIPLTLSIGVHQDYGDASVDELMRRADFALYRAKEAGGEGVITSAVANRL